MLRAIADEFVGADLLTARAARGALRRRRRVERRRRHLRRRSRSVRRPSTDVLSEREYRPALLGYASEAASRAVQRRARPRRPWTIHRARLRGPERPSRARRQPASLDRDREAGGRLPRRGPRVRRSRRDHQKPIVRATEAPHPDASVATGDRRSIVGTLLGGAPHCRTRGVASTPMCSWSDGALDPTAPAHHRGGRRSPTTR